ncbi:MAG: hypothetical protein ACPGRD_06595, partial [Planktomarina sp.]
GWALSGPPNLKRITIPSPDQLDAWLAKRLQGEGRVMLVTHADAAHPKHVGVDLLGDCLKSLGWTSERRFTLHGGLIGHVICRVGNA